MGNNFDWNAFHQQTGVFRDWQKQFPQHSGLNFTDWVKAGAPNNGQLPGDFKPMGGMLDWPDPNKAPTSTAEQNVYDFFKNKLLGGNEPFETGQFGGTPAPALTIMAEQAQEKEKKRMAEGQTGSSSAERLRGRQSTYFSAGSLLTEPNLFKSSLL